MEAGFEQVFHTQPTPAALNNTASRFLFDHSLTPPPDTGYVCEKEELSGIFVKSVTPGSAAAVSGKVRVNDRIVAVDGVSLAGKSNQRAVDALKQRTFDGVFYKKRSLISRYYWTSRKFIE
ncbi:Patj [Operophtera brumata]|uniref:Patj n=1 Tax=Operophtera brumata TaxID=104452 RepID=A0A0L7LU87_OPEBR|nr:Patj [Operophtera brumata]